MLCLALLGLPAAARAEADGTTTGGTPAKAGGQGDDTGRGSADLRMSSGALVGDPQRVSGTLPEAAAGATILVQVSDPRSGWETVATARATADGSFRAVWRAAHPGRFALRAILSAGGRAGASSRQPAPTAPISVYAPARATFFGPGFYGRRTACGVLLGPGTVGVAHRTLPCGTRLEAYYGGRRLAVTVIDRGPYVTGISWDLTVAAARALRFAGQGQIGTMVIGRGAVPAH